MRWGGLIRPLKRSAPASALLPPQIRVIPRIDTLRSSQWGGELERKRRMGGKEHTDRGECTGEERGRKSEEWLGLHGWLSLLMFVFCLLSDKLVVIEESTTQTRGCRLKFQTGKLSETVEALNYTPHAPHQPHVYTHRSTGCMLLRSTACVPPCVCCVDCWKSVFRSGSRSEDMFGFCLVSAAAVGVDYLWVSRWWTGCWSSMKCLWPRGVVACN